MLQLSQEGPKLTAYLAQVVVENMEEHSAICSQLDESIGDDLGLDAFLTRLASFIEQHAEDVMTRRGITEGPLPDDVEDMDILMNCCRAAAALQPDSTSDPSQKCNVSVFLRQHTRSA